MFGRKRRTKGRRPFYFLLPLCDLTQYKRPGRPFFGSSSSRLLTLLFLPLPVGRRGGGGKTAFSHDDQEGKENKMTDGNRTR